MHPIVLMLLLTGGCVAAIFGISLGAATLLIKITQKKRP